MLHTNLLLVHPQLYFAYACIHKYSVPFIKLFINDGKNDSFLKICDSFPVPF